MNEEGKSKKAVLWLERPEFAEQRLNEGGEWNVRVTSIKKWRSEGVEQEGVGNPKKYA